MPECVMYLATALGGGDSRYAAVLYVTGHTNHVP